jgi:biopolymer transport protein ExbD
MAVLKIRRLRRDNEADVDMTPMLDIVFIMLIFFIVTATFLDETGLDFVQPPDMPPTSTVMPSLSVYVDANDQISVEQRLSSLESIGADVERILAEKPEANIILTAEAQASLNTVTQIKDRMTQMGRQTVMKVQKPAG